MTGYLMSGSVGDPSIWFVVSADGDGLTEFTDYSQAIADAHRRADETPNKSFYVCKAEVFFIRRGVYQLAFA